MCDVRVQASVKCNMCLVSILSDGQLVFADNYGRAFDWLSLDSITFSPSGVVAQQDSIHLNLNEKIGSELVVAAVAADPDFVYLQSTQVSLKGERAAAFGDREVLLQLPADLCPVQAIIPLAFCATKVRSLSLSHVSFHTAGSESSRTALSDMAGFIVQDDVVHLYGQMAADASEKRFEVGTCLVTLPEVVRPACCHDFLVCGASNSTSATAGGAVLRLHPDGKLVFMGTTQDSAEAGVQVLSLDGVRFLTTATGERCAEKAFDTKKTFAELSLGPNVVAAPAGSSHSRSGPSSWESGVVRCCPCAGNHGDSSCLGEGKCTGGCHIPGEHRPGAFLPLGSCFMRWQIEILERAQAGGYVGSCKCVIFPCSHVVEAAKRHDEFLAGVDLNTVLVDAAAAGYTSCRCDEFPCHHVLTAAAKAKKMKTNASGQGLVAFGPASVVHRHGCCFLTGQVFKRKDGKGAFDAPPPEPALWRPGEQYISLLFLSNFVR